jgi:hypothetical protein
VVYGVSLMLLWRHWDAVGPTLATAWPSLVWPVAFGVLLMVQGSAEKMWFTKHELLQILLDVTVAQMLLMRADLRRFGWLDRTRAVMRRPLDAALASE